MKRVAISQRVDAYPDRNETRDSLDQRMVAFCIAGGYLPVPVPNLLQSADLGGGALVAAWLEGVGAEALILSGGNDIGTCDSRDTTELHLLNIAEDRRLPVLGICRGLQLLAAWSGATLHPVEGHVATRHRVDGQIARTVNSYHTFAVFDGPPDWIVLGRSMDNGIEAMQHVDLPWEGWMWHPERESTFDPADLQRLRAVLDKNLCSA